MPSKHSRSSKRQNEPCHDEARRNVRNFPLRFFLLSPLRSSYLLYHHLFGEAPCLFFWLRREVVRINI
jgi:hypothetical protein